MGYVITAGSGLLLGIGLLIWAIRERSKRADAEKGLITAQATLRMRDLAAQDMERTIKTLQLENRQINKEAVAVREAYKASLERLKACKDPEAVQSWLEEELKFKW